MSSAELTNRWILVSYRRQQNWRVDTTVEVWLGRDWHGLSFGQASWGYLDRPLWMVKTVCAPE